MVSTRKQIGVCARKVQQKAGPGKGTMVGYAVTSKVPGAGKTVTLQLGARRSSVSVTMFVWTEPPSDIFIGTE